MIEATRIESQQRPADTGRFIMSDQLTLQNGATVNGFASYDGRLIPAHVIETAIEGPVTLWRPSRGFANAIFED